MDFILNVLNFLNSLVWDTSIASIIALFGVDVGGIPVVGVFLQLPLIILLILGAGTYLTVKFKFVQFTMFKQGLNILTKNKESSEGLSPLSALLLGTATRVGTGNIVGVAAAIAMGGPGAIFWMWMSALAGMAAAFSEATLAQLFKVEEEDQTFIGGMPFYWNKLIKNRHASKVAAILLIFAFTFWLPTHMFNMLDSISILTTSLAPMANVDFIMIIALVLIIGITFAIISTGERGVSRVTDYLVPFMAGAYIIFVLISIGLNLNLIPSFFQYVFTDAFTGQAVAGGIVGVTIQRGISRGLYSNEAGQGTTTMAAATARSNHPAEQGIVQIISVAIDTLILCTATAFPIVISQAWLPEAGGATGLALVNQSFTILFEGYTWLQTTAIYLVPIALLLFAYTTIIGQILFAQINLAFLTERKMAHMIMRGFLVVVVLGFGGILRIQGIDLGQIFSIADIAGGILAICNIIVLVKAAPLLKQVLVTYRNGKRTERFHLSELEGFVDETNYWK